MFDSTCSVLKNITKDESSHQIRGDADFALKLMTSFEFVFILHFMQEIMGTTNVLCQTLHQKSQDITNALQLVASTKLLIQQFRDGGWDRLIKKLQAFCKEHDPDIPDFSASYIARNCQARKQQDEIIVEDYYRVKIFLVTIDKQLKELNHRFSDEAMELLTFSTSLISKYAYKSFNVDDIWRFVEKYYPADFNDQEKINLKFQVQHFILDAHSHPNLNDLSTMVELCRSLVETDKSKMYYLLDRLNRLILTLSVSTATTERAFSTMKLVKTRFRNRIEDEFLADNLVVHIEKDIADLFNSDSIIDDFKVLKECRAAL